MSLRPAWSTELVPGWLQSYRETLSQKTKIFFLTFSSSLFQEFNLIDRRELAPLQELIEKLGSKDR